MDDVIGVALALVVSAFAAASGFDAVHGYLIVNRRHRLLPTKKSWQTRA